MSRELRVGAQAPAWRVEEITRTDFVRFAGASGDFNPIHHDDTFARAMGYPSVFGHGMLTAGYLSRYLTEWVGVGSTRRFTVRFHGQLWPGDSISFSGTVRRELTDAPEPSVECELLAANQNGDPLVSATAVVVVGGGAG